MQLSNFGLVAALAFAHVTVAAVSISDLPSCAVEPAINALPASCAGNIACACGDSAFISSLIPTVSAACSPSELQTAIQVASQLCLENGVTLVVPGATSSSGPASTPPVVSPSIVPASTTPVYSKPAASSVAVYVSPVYTSTPSGYSSVPPAYSVPPKGNSSITTPPITSFTGAADQIKGSWAAAGILGLGALFMGL